MSKTLYEKVLDLHTVRDLGNDQVQLFVGLHLFHEATSAHAFAMLADAGAAIAFPDRNIGTVDHVIPTDTIARPFSDPRAEALVSAIEDNTRRHGLTYLSPADGEHGIVHVVGPEQGLTQPGLTLVCGDSHTATHGALGAIAFGIGTTQVRDVFATQTVIATRVQVRRIEIDGSLGPGVTAKDVILHIISVLGPQAGVGYAYEFGGTVIDAMSIEERMTVCNMAVEAGARIGYCNPDQRTYDYLRGRPYAPTGEAWDRAVRWWDSIASDAGAEYADIARIDGSAIAPRVTWGTSLGQSVPITGNVPDDDPRDSVRAAEALAAREYMGVIAGQPVQDIAIDVAFLGSCTNGRVSDFVAVGDLLERSGLTVAPGVRALAVPGSQKVHDELVALGIDRTLQDAGFEFRAPGCSMCIAINTDRLVGHEVAASSSNRNFRGRQGSPTGRTLIMSPIAVAAAAVRGHVADPREVFGIDAATPARQDAGHPERSLL
ncbi:3-isopropylmalate dehydratase OS=Tsukamurella paurometabola (strain ATCC 8368 / DSM / CCUG 35730/ CIP 100753 / JCM 10117 / KCTC 9821 / NBRC 16120 / NCIMB 702349 / NCTC 13040) OX=521096 GN=Tpau_1546 PE=4 SV=1 [Tsukamurella paurometabola]|uniref:3-isopropylmalate dehydratase n=1 Tax=Tsukamurella paurometabola (strain ATCC 8368 / DSM 20162 / CCUG 35730 / CIP 100753 / JCM 10117 / KCTC 9821 / NBRC 16120 / NCIMB 702349 / NCTC 13040) TaxID=521096 RepID=D5UY61_TSUPD|nr:3-isopropylmalate dehydratase large subunit [Tsukamurella paurometabola]ADG78168.1 aconitate hydratase domain protein [Tsukamurella paurometabola DSM 20162]SUP30508.1 3-isopropylmalate dehydratase large subunit [Tsukamurella paurometabola]